MHHFRSPAPLSGVLVDLDHVSHFQRLDAAGRTTAGSEAAKYAQRSGIPAKPVSGAAQLKDKCVVLSGLRGHQREQVMEVLEAVGGIFREEVSGTTAYLIYDPADGMETKKFAEALALQKEASGLLLMDYRELVE